MTILILILILIILILLYKIINQNNSNIDKTEIIKILLRQTSRWSNAAIQDKSPLVAVLYANYGTGYLWALHDIATDDEITNVLGFDSKKFTQIITQIQDNTTMNLIKLCPTYSNNLNEILLKIGK